MRAIYVPLPNEETRRALIQLAEHEWRNPREQAAKLLVEGLRRAGVLPDEPVEPTPQLVENSLEPGVAAR